MKTLFFASMILYALALLIQLIGILGKKDSFKKAAWASYLLGFGAHLVYFVWRGLVAQRLPLASQFEFACAWPCASPWCCCWRETAWT